MQLVFGRVAKLVLPVPRKVRHGFHETRAVVSEVGVGAGGSDGSLGCLRGGATW